MYIHLLYIQIIIHHPSPVKRFFRTGEFPDLSAGAQRCTAGKFFTCSFHIPVVVAGYFRYNKDGSKKGRAFREGGSRRFVWAPSFPPAGPGERPATLQTQGVPGGIPSLFQASCRLKGPGTSVRVAVPMPFTASCYSCILPLSLNMQKNTLKAQCRLSG